MNSDRPLTLMWLSILLIAACVFGVAACGAPVVNSNGLSWDNSAAFNREAQRTERERINANRAIREAEEWNDTMQIVGQTGVQIGAICVGLWAASKVIPAVFASIATMFAAWAARPHRPVGQPPTQIIVMAAPYLESDHTARVERIEADGYRGWAVLYPRTERFVPLQLTDSQHGG